MVVGSLQSVSILLLLRRRVASAVRLLKSSAVCLQPLLRHRRRRVACLSALLRPSALTLPVLHSIAPCPSGLLPALHLSLLCSVQQSCDRRVCCLRSVAGCHGCHPCMLPAVTPCPIIAFCLAGAPLYRPAAFALLPPLTGTVSSTHIPPPVHLLRSSHGRAYHRVVVV